MLFSFSVEKANFFIELSGNTSELNMNYIFSKKSEAELFKKKIKIPLILVGGIRSFETADELVKTGTADYISLCRPLIREPDLIKRWKSGDLRPSECISDSACFQPGMEGKGVYCVHLVDKKI